MKNIDRAAHSLALTQTATKLYRSATMRHDFAVSILQTPGLKAKLGDDNWWKLYRREAKRFNLTCLMADVAMDASSRVGKRRK